MDKKMFAKLVDLLGEFVDKSEIPPTVTFQGTTFVGMDAARVRLLDLQLPTNDETRRISGAYTVEYADLQKLAREVFKSIWLRRVHRGKMILKIDWNNRFLSVPAKRTEVDKLPRIKDRTFKTSVEIAPSDLEKLASVAKFLKTQYITITADKRQEKLFFEINEDGEDYRKRAMVFDGRIRHKDRAHYSARHLVSLLPVLDCYKCFVAFTTDYPMRITLEDYDFDRIKYYVAPRITAD